MHYYIQLAWQGRFKILRKLGFLGMKIQKVHGGQTQAKVYLSTWIFNQAKN